MDVPDSSTGRGPYLWGDRGWNWLGRKEQSINTSSSTLGMFPFQYCPVRLSPNYTRNREADQTHRGTDWPWRQHGIDFSLVSNRSQNPRVIPSLGSGRCVLSPIACLSHLKRKLLLHIISPGLISPRQGELRKLVHICCDLRYIRPRTETSVPLSPSLYRTNKYLKAFGESSSRQA